jgi:hypothetical protein
VDHVWSASAVPLAGHDDVQNTVTHELGHAIGLAHSDDPGATMYASADPEETAKRDLGDDDLWGVCDIYPGGTPRGPRSSCAASPDGARPWAAGAVLLSIVALLARRPGRGGRRD